MYNVMYILQLSFHISAHCISRFKIACFCSDIAWWLIHIESAQTCETEPVNLISPYLRILQLQKEHWSSGIEKLVTLIVVN